MKTTYSLLLLFVCFVFYGCTSLDHVEPKKGDIEGYIDLGTIPRLQQLNADNSGVTVRLEDIDPAIEVQTDVSGHWIMKDVPAGTYTLTYFKEGYDRYKQFSVQHVGGKASTFPYLDDNQHIGADIQTLPYLNDKLVLYPLTKTKVVSFKSTGIDGSNLTFQGTAAGDPGSKRVLFFVKNKGVASPTNYDYVQYTFASGTPISFSLNLNLVVLGRFGFKSGDEVSVKAYGFANNPTGQTNLIAFSYYDPALGLRVYTNISQEGIEAKVKMP